MATAPDGLEVRLLGGFRVTVGGRALPDGAWRRKRAAAVVKLLALAPRHRLHREEVLEALWPELDPEAAAGNLRFALHQARKRLEEASAPAGAFLARDGEGLVLGPPDMVRVDADAFEAAAQAAWRAPNPAAAEAALALYAGDLLPEDPYEAWAEGARDRLRAGYLALLRRLAELRERGGDPTAAAAALERAVAAEPTDEATHAALMRLLAAAGQRQRALAQYERLAATLAREVGAAPERATRELAAAIREGRFPEATQPLEPAVAHGRVAALRTGLPAPVDALIGRERERAEVGQLLATGRLVMLTGPGGIGKTRLALEVACELAPAFADGAAFVDLSAVRDPDLVLPTVAATLGVREAGGRSLRDDVIAALRDKRLLVVLDNFEQVLAAAPVVAELLAACPHLKVLATSRARLRLRGEREYPLRPLALPAPGQLPEAAALSHYGAVALFVERAREARPGFAVTNATAPAVAAICHKLDGLPLAIELAAARLRLLPPPELLARLDRPLGLLVDGPRDLPERQRTIRATVAWSHDLLPPEQQALFRRLAVFSGGFALPAAEEVATGGGGPGLDVLGGLGALVDASLVVGPEQADAEPRYRMLETIREFGLEQLAASGEAEAVRQRHAAYFVALAEQAAPELERSAQTVWHERLEAEHANVRAALGWLRDHGRVEDVLRAGAAIWTFWFKRHAEEGLRWLEGALAAADGVDPRVRADALHGAGNLARARADPARGEALHREELALRRAIGDEAGIGKTLLPLGLEALEQDDYGRAEALLAESVGRLRGTVDAWAYGIALGCLGEVAGSRGDYERAKALCEESLGILRELGDLHAVACSRGLLGGLAAARGDWAGAVALHEEGLRLHRLLGDRANAVISLGNLGQAAIAMEDLGRAEALFEEALAEEWESGAPPVAWIPLGLGRVFWLRGDHPRAAAHYREAIGRLQAKSRNRRLLAVECLEELGAVAVAQGRPEPSARLLGAAVALRAAIGAPPPPSERDAHERAIAAARESLGEEAFAAAWVGGRALPLEQALAEALAVATEVGTGASDAGRRAALARNAETRAVARVPTTAPRVEQGRAG